MKRTVTSVVKGLFLDLAVIAASVYLTFVIGEYMPDLPADQLLVFGCTAAVCACLVYAFGALRRKFPRRLRFTAVSFGFAAVSAGLLLTAFQGVLLPRNPEITVTLAALPADGGARWGDVLLVEAESGGREVPVRDLVVTDNSGWTYHEEWDDYIFSADSEEQVRSGNRLTVYFAGDALTLRFAQNELQGRVRVTDSTGSFLERDLYAAGYESAPVEVALAAPAAFSLLELLVYQGGCYLVLLFLAGWVCSLGLVENILRSRFSLPLCMTAAFFLLFFHTPEITLEPLALAAVTALTTAACSISEENAQAYGGVFRRVVIGLLALCNAAALFGPRFPAGSRGVFYLLVGTIWLIPILGRVFFWLGRLAARWGLHADLGDLNTVPGLCCSFLILCSSAALTHLLGRYIPLETYQSLLVMEGLVVLCGFLVLMKVRRR